MINDKIIIRIIVGIRGRDSCTGHFKKLKIRRSFQKFCALRLHGLQDDAIILIFATAVSQTSVQNNLCVLAGYVVPVLQNGALKWKKRLTGARSPAASCLRCSIGNFGNVWIASASPPAVQS
jgi:hypothetical protein